MIKKSCDLLFFILAVADIPGTALPSFFKRRAVPAKSGGKWSVYGSQSTIMIFRSA